MLNEIHKFEQIDCNEGLTDKCCKVGQTPYGERCEQCYFDEDRNGCVLFPDSVCVPELLRNGSHKMTIDTTPPWRTRWIDLASPVLVVCMVVFDCKVQVEDAQQIKAP